MKFAISMILLFAFSRSIYAETFYQGVDISPMVEYYGKQVSVLNRPITTYNWSKNQNAKVPSWFERLTSEPDQIAQDDPRYLEHIREWAKVFWQNFGNRSGGNMFGYGLYLAADPRSTQTYGGKSGNWSLMQINLPVGLRILDFPSIYRDKPYDDPSFVRILELQSKFGCSVTIEAENLFRYGGENLAPACAKLVEEIFRNILKIDAIAYSYGSTRYRACPGSILMQDRAFVLLNGDQIKTDDVHVYDSSSRLNRIERVRIQTLVSMHPVDGGSIKPTFLHPLLWPDIEGEEKSPNIGQWLLENRFGCDGSLPYTQSK